MELKTSPGNGTQPPNPEPKPDPSNPGNAETQQTQLENQLFFEDYDSTCSTPYVSAPSSPGRSGPVSGFFYSAPASPMHFALTTKSNSSSFEKNGGNDSGSVSMGFEFEFSARFGSSGSGPTGPMSSADELFLNGKIRPMKLSTHLEKPQTLAPLLDLEPETGEDEADRVGFEPVRGRDLRFRDKSLRRRTRSLSPLRNEPFEWGQNDEILEADEKDCNFAEDPKGAAKNGEEDEEGVEESSTTTTTPSVSASSSRSSSVGRNSKRWVFLKEFLHRSKSEGRSSNYKFWSSISFSAAKEKKPMKQGGQNAQGSVSKDPKCSNPLNLGSEGQKLKGSGSGGSGKKTGAGKPTNGVGKRRHPPSLHELHYTANRAQAEEMRKKTYLPYRQGLLGCLGFSSKGYGAAMNSGFARALNPVSSR
ncbi:unnamed protein product [Malus baccata var. baccata]